MLTKQKYLRLYAFFVCIEMYMLFLIFSQIYYTKFKYWGFYILTLFFVIWIRALIGGLFYRNLFSLKDIKEQENKRFMPLNMELSYGKEQKAKIYFLYNYLIFLGFVCLLILSDIYIVINSYLNIIFNGVLLIPLPFLLSWLFFGKKDYFKKYFSEGLKNFEKQDYSGAISKFLKAIEISSEFFQAWLELAKSHYMILNYKEALHALTKAFKLNNTNSKIIELFGDIYSDMNDTKQACSYYEHTIELSPENGYAWQKLAQIYMALGQEKESKMVIKRATSLISLAEKNINIKKKYLKNPR